MKLGAFCDAAGNTTVLPAEVRSGQADGAGSGMDARRGFLPAQDPLTRLPPAFDAWEDAAARLPKLLVSDQTRRTLEPLPPFPVEAIAGVAELERAGTLLGCLSHAYVWRGEAPARVLPERLAAPWHAFARRLGKPPVLTYSIYVLNNYMRLDARREMEAGNLALIQNIRGGLDEEWLVVIHMEIERQAAPAIASLHNCLDAAECGDAAALEQHLATVQASIESMRDSLCKMKDWCDPHVYYHRVRPYLNGWKGNAALPCGLIYDGAGAYQGIGQRFRGPTGAQSAIFALLDAMFGIGQQTNGLGHYLMEMRGYMPHRHRAFLESVEAREPVRPFVERCGWRALTEVYDAGVDALERFRKLHLQYAAT